MAKRNIAAELIQGLEEIRGWQKGQVKLNDHSGSRFPLSPTCNREQDQSGGGSAMSNERRREIEDFFNDLAKWNKILITGRQLNTCEP